MGRRRSGGGRSRWIGERGGLKVRVDVRCMAYGSRDECMRERVY